MTDEHHIGYCDLDGGTAANVLTTCHYGKNGITAHCRMGWPLSDCPNWHDRALNPKFAPEKDEEPPKPPEEPEEEPEEEEPEEENGGEPEEEEPGYLGG